jgi:hypothetical protein
VGSWQVIEIRAGRNKNSDRFAQSIHNAALGRYAAIFSSQSIQSRYFRGKVFWNKELAATVVAVLKIFFNGRSPQSIKGKHVSAQYPKPLAAKYCQRTTYTQSIL